jgi:hypothetical protein
MTAKWIMASHRFESRRMDGNWSGTRCVGARESALGPEGSFASRCPESEIGHPREKAGILFTDDEAGEIGVRLQTGKG